MQKTRRKDKPLDSFLSKLQKGRIHRDLELAGREFLESELMREYGFIPAIILYGLEIEYPVRYYKPREGLLGRLKDLIFGKKFVETTDTISIPGESLSRLSNLLLLLKKEYKNKEKMFK